MVREKKEKKGVLCREAPRSLEISGLAPNVCKIHYLGKQRGKRENGDLTFAVVMMDYVAELIFCTFALRNKCCNVTCHSLRIKHYLFSKFSKVFSTFTFL